MLRIEAGLIVLALLTAWAYPALGCAWFDRVERRFSALARRRALSVLVVGAAALLLRLAVLPVEPVPEPIVHDEFGYLLAANTFAHGRLTNPTPPMWEHFETFSILMKPTYQCFGQPAQGMLLALGKIVFGHPFWGVWLSCGLMCAAITWMLQGWLSAEWALLGGFLAVLRYGVFGYWTDSYWGGALAALGGALVLGALPRIKESQRIRDALLMGIGLALLAGTRPYEGFVFSLPVAVILIAWLFSKKSPSFKATLARVVVPITLVLALTGAFLGYYFWRVTGSPVRMPYEIERQTYAVAPYMLWQHVRPEPAYRHAIMRKMYSVNELASYKFLRTFPGLFMRLYIGWSFFLGAALSLPLLMLAYTLPRGFSLRDISPTARTALILFAISLAAWCLESFYNPHYSAPATCLIILLVLLAMRQMRAWGKRGLFLARALPVICVVCIGVRALAAPLHVPLSQFYEFSCYQQNVPSFGRAQLERQLEKLPGKQIVIVRYGPQHDPFAEWVYNAPDPSTAKIIWAREMDPGQDQGLLQYYRDRHAWLLEADAVPLRLVAYPGSPAAPAFTTRLRPAGSHSR